MFGAIIAKQAIRSTFNALNESNLEKFMKAWSENSVFIYPGRVKAGGKFTGKSQTKKWFEEFIKQFPERKFTVIHVGVDNIFDMVGNNTIFVQLEIELTNKDGFECTNSGISMIELKWGKVVRVEDFLRVIDGDVYKKGWGDIN